MKSIQLPQIEVDNSILLSLKTSPKKLADDMKLYTAIALYRKKGLSLGKAAQFLGVDKIDFINILKKENTPIFDYSDEEIEEIKQDALDILEITKW